MCIAIFALVGIFYWQYFEAQKEIKIFEQKMGTTELEEVKTPEGWQSYTDEKNIYIIYYPIDWGTENLQEQPIGAYYSMRAFAKTPIKKFIEDFSYMQDGIIVSVSFSKLPLEAFVKYRAGLAQSFLDTMSSPQEITIDGKNALLFTSDSADGLVRLAAVKNNDYVILTLIGSDYKKDVYTTILTNIKLIPQEKIIVEKEKIISAKNWKFYTDKPFGNNPFGYSVPDYYLSMKIPQEFEQVEKTGAVKFRVDDGIEFTVGFIGTTEELYKKAIKKYKEMAIGETMNDSHRQILKINDVNSNGCVGPQIFVESSGEIYPFKYQTHCLMENNFGEKAYVNFFLGSDIRYVENIDQYKAVYDKIISTFRYQVE